MENLKKTAPGLLVCLALAVPSWFLGHAFPVIGGSVFAILAGMIVAMIIGSRTVLQPGIAFTSKKILQYAVILLGFGLNLSQIAKVGLLSLPIICTTITVSLVIAFLLKKYLTVPNNISVLVGVGSSICGGSAIAATAPVIGADDEEIAQSISVIFLFNILAALIFPTLGGILGMSNEGFGLFAGTAINDTSSVTAAASTWDTLHNTSGVVLNYATIVKLTRTLAIPHHPGPCLLAHLAGEAGWRRIQRVLPAEKNLPLLYPLVRSGLHHHHDRYFVRYGCRRLPAL